MSSLYKGQYPFIDRERLSILNEIYSSNGTCLARASAVSVNIEKPDECPVCFESLENQKTPLICGHWVHLSCIEKHFKAECPICRRPLEMEVYGTISEPDMGLSNVELSDTDSEREYYYYEENELHQEILNDRENDFILARILADEGASERLLNDPSSPLYAIPVGRS